MPEKPAINRADNSSGERPRTRRLRFSLKSLLLLTTAVASALGWGVWYRGWFARQAEAVELLNESDRAQNWTQFDWSNTWRRWILPEELARHDYLFELTKSDDELFQQLARISVRGICVNTSSFDDKALQKLVACTPDLQVLILRRSNVTNVGLQALDSLSRLHTLHLGDLCIYSRDPSGTGDQWFEFRADQFTDDALAIVKSLPELRDLRIVSNNAGDNHLAPLSQNVHLETFLIVTPHLNDECLANISAIAGLKALFLGGGELKGDGLGHLRSLRQIRTLAFKSCRIAPKAWPPIAELKSIEGLCLENTGLQNEDLRRLAALPNLWNLYLAGAEFDNGLLQNVNDVPKLAHLHLHQTGVNDDGIVELAKLNLTEVFVTKQQFSPAALKRLPKKTAIFDAAMPGDPPILFFGMALNRPDMHSDIPPRW